MGRDISKDDSMKLYNIDPEKVSGGYMYDVFVSERTHKNQSDTVNDALCVTIFYQNETEDIKTQHSETILDMDTCFESAVVPCGAIMYYFYPTKT